MLRVFGNLYVASRSKLLSANHLPVYLPRQACNTVTPNLLRFWPRILCWDIRGFLLRLASLSSARTYPHSLIRMGLVLV